MKGVHLTSLSSTDLRTIAKAGYVVLCMLFLHSYALTQEKDWYDYDDMPYENRIKLSSIKGVYIPADLNEVIEQFVKLTSESSRNKFKNMNEDSVALKLHFSLGKWMTKHWGFYLGTRLSHYLVQLGIHHPDDMAEFLIITIHRSLNNQPLEVLERAGIYKSKRKQEWLERTNKGETLELMKINNADTLRLEIDP